jgi:Trypsin-co-occurring domain 2
VEAAENAMPLRDFISGLRAELRAAHDEGEQDGVEPRFIVGPVNVEFTVAATKEGGVNGGVRFYVFQLGASGSISSATTQRVSLTLKPVTVNGDPYDAADEMSVVPQ